MLKTKSSLILLWSIFCGLASQRAFALSKAAYISILTEKGKTGVGDENQSQGVADFLEEKLLQKGFTVKRETNGQVPNNNENIFILVSGEAGLSLLENQQNFSSKATWVWTGHQYFKKLSALKQLSARTFLFLPSTSLKEIPKNVQDRKDLSFFGLQGIPHRVSPKTIAKNGQEYEKKHEPIHLPKDAVLVILGGDAPDLNGDLKFFTPIDAKQLAQRIVKLEGNTHPYFVINSPRTGKFDAVTKKEVDPNPHQSNKLDKVTEGFVEALKHLEVVNVKVFDFQFSDTPSPYMHLLQAAINQKHVSVHVTGESISMSVEVSDILHNHKVFFDEVPSMNPSHLEFIQSLVVLNKGSLLKMDGTIHSYPKQGKIHEKHNSENKKLAAEVVADYVLEKQKI